MPRPKKNTTAKTTAAEQPAAFPTIAITMAEGARLPRRATDGSSGYDCYAYNITVHLLPGTYGNKPQILIPAGQTIKDTLENNRITPESVDYIDIDTGIAIAPPASYATDARAQSRIAKRGFTFQLGVGTIDADYRGTIHFLYAPRHRYADYSMFALNQKCGQLLITRPITNAVFLPVAELPATQRGTGGFGSTGNK